MGVFILRQENFRPSALPPRRASERGHHAKWIDHVLARKTRAARSQQRLQVPAWIARGADAVYHNV